MIIIQDTREQSPLEFTHEFITGVEKMALPVGDYCVKYSFGYIPQIIFERKSIGDLFGTLGSGYVRFKKEIEKAKTLDIKLILIIEGSLSKVLKGYEASQISGFSIVKKLFTLFIRYNLMPVFCKDREEMSRYITEFYLALGRNIDWKKKNEIKIQ